MRANTQEQQALVTIMHGQYERIRAIEAPWGIRQHEGDLRPRIDYFHDAVRALTSGQDDGISKHSRLSVERLAYDITQLRMIQGSPLGRYQPMDTASPGAALIKHGELPPGTQSRPDRTTRQELATLYKDYTVMFAALFSEAADNNFQVRAEEADRAVADLAVVEQVLEQLASGAITPQQAEAAMDGIDNDQLRDQMVKLIRTQGNVKRHQQLEVSDMMREAERGLNAEKKAMDQAHMTYATSRLMVYEDARDTVKRLAGQGLNLAGKFVENAINQQQKGQGRGF